MWLSWKDLAWSELVVYNQEKWFSLVHMGPSKKSVLITERRATNLWFNPKIRTNRELLRCSPDPCCNHSPDLHVPFLLKKMGERYCWSFHILKFYEKGIPHIVLFWNFLFHAVMTKTYLCWVYLYLMRVLLQIFCWVPFLKNAFHLTWWRRQTYSQ